MYTVYRMQYTVSAWSSGPQNVCMSKQWWAPRWARDGRDMGAPNAPPGAVFETTVFYNIPCYNIPYDMFLQADCTTLPLISVRRQIVHIARFASGAAKLMRRWGTRDGRTSPLAKNRWALMGADGRRSSLISSSFCNLQYILHSMWLPQNVRLNLTSYISHVIRKSFLCMKGSF